jgi:hypothetical protein
VADRALDGGLDGWSELEGMGWEHLLIGNRMSANISSYFAYDSLYEEACKDFDGSLEDSDITLKFVVPNSTKTSGLSLW